MGIYWLKFTTYNPADPDIDSIHILWFSEVFMLYGSIYTKFKLFIRKNYVILRCKFVALSINKHFTLKGPT